MSSLSLVAPVSGVFVALEKVADPVFAEKIMGDGFAIEPSSNELIAPCDGVISQIAGALHALSLTAENGAEILLHIGLDTVQLKGQGFSTLVKVGDEVKQGQCLIRFDLALIQKSCPAATTLLVVTNTDQFRFADAQHSGAMIAGKTPCLSLLSAQEKPQQSLTLLAPLSGPIVPLATVSDPIFAEKVMGDGLAVNPQSNDLLAPCDGVISQLSKTSHALSLTADNGAEILLHIGIDTVQLKGEGFSPKVKEGERVKCGQCLIQFDRELITKKAPSPVTMLIVVNTDQFDFSDFASGNAVAGQSAFLTLTKKEAASSAAQTTQEGNEISGEATVHHSGGLHARPAALVQNAARPFLSDVQIEWAGKRANAKSIVALMGLVVGENDRVKIHVRGVDAAESLAAVIKALETKTEGGHGNSGNNNERIEAVPKVQILNDGRFAGVCAAPGLAIGQIVRIGSVELKVPEKGQGAEFESKSLMDALNKVRESINTAINDALKRGSTAESDIFAAHLALLDDPELIEGSKKHIAEGFSAGRSFRLTINAQCAILASLGNQLLAERVGDLKDILRRVLLALGAEEGEKAALFDHSILLAEDLAPSELTSLPRDKVAGMITSAGGATAHVAILARSFGIPALVACGEGVLGMQSGQTVLLDAVSGICDPHPTEETLAKARADIEKIRLRQIDMQSRAGSFAVTKDGIQIEVAVNIANAQDAKEGLNFGADSVGLTRTEFLFLERKTAPTVDEQRIAYQSIIDSMQGKNVIIRTMDVGGDKEVPYMVLPPEANPALGLRGIRGQLVDPKLADAQLEALLQVKPLSAVRILLPMISEPSDLQMVRDRIETLAAKMGLTERPQIGAMIEVPSAALMASQLARQADFFSIGTNDLTQYTLAMDRCNASLAPRLDALHPSVLRLIALTVEGAMKHGRWVGVCGALASDPDAVPVLVGLGISELSVSAPLIPEIKDRIRGLTFSMCHREAKLMLEMRSAEEVRARIKVLWNQE